MCVCVCLCVCVHELNSLKRSSRGKTVCVDAFLKVFGALATPIKCHSEDVCSSFEEEKNLRKHANSILCQTFLTDSN